ncbi:endoribonuclease L-PSP [Aspergillus arachidicola]|uniref:Endoribonuclease L-PSP n=1 Tax=Aspergillus arachidicola TaxID=656916 RepID=A0A2G7FEG8_9EURO|nr:endoribonuclease L-PSP [Aspergillus arachidicola]
MNEAYAKNIPEGVKPVRTCVAVKELPFGSDGEIECIAALDAVSNDVAAPYLVRLEKMPQ